MVAALAMRLPKSAEQGDEEEETSEEGLTTKLVQSLNQIKEAIKLPEIYLTLSFFVLKAAVTPSFSNFMYFF